MNDSVFGFVVGIWMCDYKCVWCIVWVFEMGIVWINMYKLFLIFMLFLGWKESGMGCEKGCFGICEYM